MVLIEEALLLDNYFACVCAQHNMTQIYSFCLVCATDSF